MTSVLTAALPRPRNAFAGPTSEALAVPAPSAAARRQMKQPPPYGQRDGFIPRNEEDFADGGAFPEIHLAQYPLSMGRKHATGASNALSIQLDSTGKVKYETILGHGKDKIVHSTALALTDKAVDEEELVRPSEEEEAEATARTRAALEKIVNSKIVAARPAQPGEKQGDPTYIRYTPAGGQSAAAAGHNSGAKQRIIRLVEMPKDPMEPPKFKHKKTPAGPPSPPAPVVHSPPRKVTVADQQAWKIPPCISNWKNAKGYTIPLDKRLAADGRALQEVQINDSFAKLSEALYIAERRAREEVARRAAIARQIMVNEKTEQEETLRRLAEEARKGKATEMEMEEEDLDEEDVEAKKERDELRYERKRERDRKRHLDNYQGKKKLKTDDDRDVSEKVALGEAPTASADTMFDARLFNQSQGMDSGFADEEAYNVYDKPLFQGSSANFLYRPKKDNDSEVYGGEDDEEGGDDKQGTDKFKPNRDFSGVDRSRRAEPRRAPVEFEKEEDPFGLDEFLTEAKETQKKKPLDHIGSSNTMHAAGGGTRDTMSDRSKIQFESSGAAPETIARPPSSSSSSSSSDRDRHHREERSRDSERDRDHGDRRDRERDRDRDRDRDHHRSGGRDERRGDRDRDRDERRSDRDRDRDYDRRRR